MFLEFCLASSLLSNYCDSKRCLLHVFVCLCVDVCVCMCRQHGTLVEVRGQLGGVPCEFWESNSDRCWGESIINTFNLLNNPASHTHSLQSFARVLSLDIINIMHVKDFQAVCNKFELLNSPKV